MKIKATLLVLATLLCTTPALAETPSYDARLTAYDYPYKVQMLDLESQRQNVQMAYMYLPAAEGKPTALLLHGKNFSGAYWQPVAEWLHEHGYGVIMPDQIGFGKSSKPQYYQFSFNQLAANTRALLEKLGIQNTIVVGHSMGGMLATRYALTYPAHTSKLILINPIGLEDYLEYTTYPSLDQSYAAELKKTPEGIIAYQRKNYYDGQWNERYEALTEFLQGWVNGQDKQRVAWNSALTYDMILTQPVVHEMGELSMPTTLIIGTRDRTGLNRANKKPDTDYELGRYDQLGKATAQRIPHATLYELEGLGHLPQVENWDRFAEVFEKAMNAE